MKQRLSTYFIIIMGAIILLPLLSLSAACHTLECRYASITYADIKELREFNNELYMGRLSSQLKKSDTIEGEVISKINYIVEKVMVALDMFPSPLKFAIVIHPDENKVQDDFRRIYNIDVDYIAFYSPSKNTVFYASDEINLRVVAHEIGHVVVENYFTISPPQKIHEVMAQFAEQHVTD